MAMPDDDPYSRLPQGVLSDLGGWTLYQSFRTFTWPWWVRRGAVFWPLAILAGCAYAAWHASGMGAWRDWPGLALRATIAALITVSLGPLLATIVRHRKLPFRVERVLVILAILLGLWIGLVALDWAGAYHAQLMRGYSTRPMNVSFFGQLMSNFFRASIDASIFMLVFAGGGLAIVYYVGERRRIEQHGARRQVEHLRAERDAADMRLAVLQAQIEPHFLFNTLASVRSLIASEPEHAARTIDALADYLRATLPRFRETSVEAATLDRQIDICTRYLELMNVRMAGRIRVEVEASDTIRTLQFPPLVLLTLVENAVKHGVEPAAGPRMIAIRAHADDEALTVTVEDDGAGLEPGVTPGLGLANIRAQLRNRFGDSAALEVGARPDGGTRALIRVPLAAA
ncbi:MAG: hypothetical protein JWM65_152 [Sphingomonas bacterium]|nr:hypothetical protein [Sphingomonas bacterium]